MFDIRIGKDSTLHFSGRLDASQSTDALNILSEVDRPATADFSNLDYISSAGIGVILATFQRLSDSGHAFQIINVTPRVATVFRYAGLTDVLGIKEQAPG